MKLHTPTLLRVVLSILLIAFFIAVKANFLTPDKPNAREANPVPEGTRSPDASPVSVNQQVATVPAPSPGMEQRLQAPRRLLNFTGQVKDKPLEAGENSGKNVFAGGREFAMSMPDLAKFAPGDVILVPMPDGRSLRATVNISREDLPTTWVLAAGFDGESGGLTLRQDKGCRALFGRIIKVDEHVAYTISTDEAGVVWATERLREQLLPSCAPPLQPQPTDATAAPFAAPGPAAGPPPILNSKPYAQAVLYIDLDGEAATTYPDWPTTNPGGVTFACGDPNFTTEQMIDIWTIVAEDYAPFNINVTTDAARYDAPAAVGKRMRCIVADGTGAVTEFGSGLALIGSFRPGALNSGGNVVATDCPCWVTLQGYTIANPNRHRIMAHAVAHEFGHTLGLSHDGPGPGGYYTGHGISPNDWAPIMGNYRGVNDLGTTVVQWSKGEYANANNTEDDVAILSGAANGFGFEEDESSGIISARPITLDGSPAGIISSQTDSDFFSIDTAVVGNVTLAISSTIGSTGQARNLDVGVRLLDATGAQIASSAPDDSMDASITTNLAAGRYYLEVFGGNRGTGSSGWTNYGSLGGYSISGTLPQPPFATISYPGNGGTIAGLNQITGTAGGSNLTGAVTLAIIGPGNEYWTGSAWSATLATVSVNITGGTWAYSSLPTGLNIRTGSYHVTAIAYNLSGTPSQSNADNDINFNVTPSLDTIPPTCSIVSPVHNLPRNNFVELTGTAADLGGSGLVPAVSVSINNGGDYWNGSQWVSTPVAVSVPVAADGTWTHTSLPSGGNLRPGIYAVSATSHDFGGNQSAPDADPAGGMNSILFTVDTMQPNVAITSPANGTTLTTTSYLFHGTATDVSGIDYVNCFLRRNSDNQYWNGTGWVATAVPLSTIHDSGSGQWALTVLLPRPGLQMANGSYNFIAIATDLAGNSRQTDSEVTVSYFAPPLLAASHVDFSNTNAGANDTVGTLGWRYGYYPNTGTTGPFSTTGMAPANPSYADGPYPSWRGNADAPTPVHTMQEMHPGLPTNYTVVRRYTLNPGGSGDNDEPFHNGPFRVVGRFYDMNTEPTEGFITVNGVTVIGPTPIGSAGGTVSPGSRKEGGQLAFDLTINGPLAPGSTFDFGVTAANGSANSDATGFVAWIMSDDSPVPTNIVANTYHSANVAYPNNPDARGDAFVLATDGRIGAANADCFDTYPAPLHPNQFAGLLYLEQASTTQATRFDSVRIDMGTQFGDGGDFGATPRLFLLRHNSDPNTSDPTTDDRYVEMPVVPAKATNGSGRPYYTFDLANVLHDDRIGYGFAVVGPGSSTGRFISVAEISATTERVSNSGIPVVAPVFHEFQGHRYALTITRGTWQDCENEAVAMGGHLVAIGSKEENEWLVNTFGDEQLFIGLRRIGSAWSWSNGGEGVDFTSWGQNQPDNLAPTVWTTLNCVGEFGRWHDTAITGYPETGNYRGIIELPSAGPLSPELRLTVAGRSTIFGAGHNKEKVFPAPPAARPAADSIPPPYVRLPGSGSRKVVFGRVGGSIYTGADTVGPDGGRHPSYQSRLCDILPVSPANGISGYKNLDNVPAMLGVFLSDAEPEGAPPPTLDFSNAVIGQNFSELMPEIGQVFFIGDGRQTDGTRQAFIVPEGATRLYLGFPDAWENLSTPVYTGLPNAYGDNTGSFVAHFAVEADPTPRIVDTSLPTLGQKFRVIGGTGPYAWSIAGGDLPPHLTLLADGTLSASGQPVVNGNYTFTVSVTDLAQPGVSADREFTVSVLEPVPHPDDIVAWWPAQNAAGDVIGDFQGIRRNGASYADGKSGRAFSFDGVNDLIEVPHVAGLDLPGSLTIEGWILRNSGSTIIGKRSPDNANVAYVFFVQTDGRLAFSSRSGGGAFSEVSTTAPAVMTGVWHHVAVTIGGNEARFYVDGTMVSAASYAASRPAVSAPATIGATVTTSFPIGSPTGALNGRIDELCLYNRALSATEIAAIASAGTAGKARYDLALDFSYGTNSAEDDAPNRPWVYGAMDPDVTLPDLHRTPVPGTFTPFTASGIYQTTGRYWHAAGSDPPNIHRNYGPGNVGQGTWVLLPGQVAMHPSSTGHFSVARWIAPAAGTYKVSASFSRTDSGGGTRKASGQIFHNTAGLATEIAYGIVEGPSAEMNVTRVVTVALGDKVDFIAGTGGDGYDYDAVGVAASIVAVDDIIPPPDVTTAEPPTLTNTTASLAAIVNPNGFATQLRFRYGTDPTLATFTETTPFSIGSTGPSYSTQGVGGLSPHTHYYYRAVAESSAGTSIGAILSFETSNSAPIAQADRFAVLNEPSGQAFTLDVRANDSDPDGDALVVSSVVAPSHGTVSIGAGGTNIVYRPPPGHSGTVSFNYTVLDGVGGSATTTATVDVQQSFASWAAAEGLEPGENGPGDDADNDGITNAFEFFHGMDPKGGAGDLSGLPVVEVIPGPDGPAFLGYTYRRNLLASFPAVEHERGAGLGAGDWTTVIPVETTVLSTDPASGTQIIQVKIAVPPGSDSQFVRIKLSH